MNGFWTGRRVLVTGHTGFKGAWLSFWLAELGAHVSGFALAPDTEQSLFEQLSLPHIVDHRIGDIREAEGLAARVREVQPDVVFHLAAQSLVRRSYRQPLETWSVNVMGTVHLLDALRGLTSPCAVVIVTTDKVYENREWLHAYRETDRLGGKDPYSASKAACELVVESYRKSYFTRQPVKLATARAGNVIGGGDWAEDRVVPDLARALAKGQALGLRNPDAVRPWQHALDPLNGYMLLAERLWQADAQCESAFNFGPDPSDRRRVRDLVSAALRHWPGEWRDASDRHAPAEAGLLNLANDKARAALGWTPRWSFEEATRQTMEWYRKVHEGASPRDVTLAQIRAFEARAPT